MNRKIKSFTALITACLSVLIAACGNGTTDLKREGVISIDESLLRKRIPCPEAQTPSRYDQVSSIDGGQTTYYIYNASQLASIAMHADAYSQQFVQCAPIDLREYYTYKTRFFTIGGNLLAFEGHYDGNHYPIKGFRFDTDFAYAPNLPVISAEGQTIRDSFDNIGLFGKIGGSAVIQNMILENPQVRATGYRRFIGSFAGAIDMPSSAGVESAKISKILVINPYVDADYSVGGFVGRVYGVVDVTDVNIKGGEVRGLWQAGGAFGEALRNTSVGEGYATKISHVSTSANVGIKTLSETGNSHHGGFVGYAERVVIEYCSATGNLNQIDTYTDQRSPVAGGFIGTVAHDAQISWSYATGNVTANRGYLGGFVGKVDINRVKLSNVYAAGTILNKAPAGNDRALASGFIAHVNYDFGPANIELKNVYSSGEVRMPNHNGSGDAGAGGIFGHTRQQMASSVIQDSFTVSNIIAPGLSQGHIGYVIGYRYDSTFPAVTNLFNYSGAICQGQTVCNEVGANPVSTLQSFHEPTSSVFQNWEFGRQKWNAKFAIVQNANGFGIEYVGPPTIPYARSRYSGIIGGDVPADQNNADL
ncbi:MAG: hypothetical protein KDD48_05230 [Bdellovibrionales bacterium]|nr:hypothetical protein [Bdellovibrionales bacterium]